MGEHTIREILRRRSPETQRAMKRRRELAGVTSRGGSLLPKLIILGVVLAILAYAGYMAWMARDAGLRFAVERTAHPHELTLAGTTEFLPNTLLSSMDPAFYNPNSLSGAALTRRLMKLYYPDASAIELRVMSVSVEAQYPKTEIMESYLNVVPMAGAGHSVKGLAAASNFYFGKPFAQLSPQDIALLVALIKDPVGLDPREFPEKAYDARNLVLQADLQQNVLSQAQVDTLSKMPLDVIPLASAAPAAAPAPAAPAPQTPVKH